MTCLKEGTMDIETVQNSAMKISFDCNIREPEI